MGIKNGEMVNGLVGPRERSKRVAMVTTRFRPFKIAARPFIRSDCPGASAGCTPKDGGDSANLLTPNVGDPNTMIPETKAFMVNVTKAE